MTYDNVMDFLITRRICGWYHLNERLERRLRAMFHMKKTAKSSFFVRADLKSQVGENLDGDIPKYKGKDVVILQVSMINERHLTMMYEVVFKEDFNGLWKD